MEGGGGAIAPPPSRVVSEEFSFGNEFSQFVVSNLPIPGS